MSAQKVEEAARLALASLPQQARVFIAVSGGLDSVTLLHACHRVLSRSSRYLAVLHVNHGLRSEESEGDEAFVNELCKSLQIPFFSELLTWEKERPSQDLSRRKRMAFFARMLNQEDDCIFLGHHQDDQAETILQRLIRGSGLRGIRGMAPASGGKIRPFLTLSRDEILAAAKVWKLKWREDSSNSQKKYDRNWIRHELMPLLESRRPGVSRRLAALAAEARGFPLLDFRPDCFDSRSGWRLFARQDLLVLPDSGISHFFGLSRLHTQKFRELLLKGSGAHCAPGIDFRLSAGILLQQKPGTFAGPVEFERNGAGRVSCRSLLGHWILHLKEEDVLGGQKDLDLGECAKKEFQRLAVPLFMRDQIPLLVRGGKPLALLPVRIKKLGSMKVEAEFSPAGAWWLERSQSMVKVR